MVEGLLGGGEERKGGGDIGGEVVGHGDGEKGRVGEDAGAALEGGFGDAAVAFGRDGEDGVVGVVLGG